MRYTTPALAVLLALPGLGLAQEMVNAEAYRAALQDKFANPGTMVADRGEGLFKTPRGPQNVSLEKCDFGLGAGKLAGAYAQLPRYFKDSDKVEATGIAPGDLHDQACRASPRKKSPKRSLAIKPRTRVIPTSRPLRCMSHRSLTACRSIRR